MKSQLVTANPFDPNWKWTELVPTLGKSNQNWTGKMSELTFLCSGVKPPKIITHPNPLQEGDPWENISNETVNFCVVVPTTPVLFEQYQEQTLQCETLMNVHLSHNFLSLGSNQGSNTNLLLWGGSLIATETNPYTFKHSQKPIFIQHASNLLKGFYKYSPHFSSMKKAFYVK